MAKALDDVLKEGWKHGPLGCLGECKPDSVQCKTALVGCPFPCIQFGITERALGHNFWLGCCFAAHCTHCAAYTQRRHIKKGALVLDCLLAWFCPHCVIMQNANEVGEAATITHWSIGDLIKPPTGQDIKKEIDDTVKDATNTQGL